MLLTAVCAMPALADLPARAPVFLPQSAALAIHGTPAGRAFSGLLSNVEPTAEGSRVTVALKTALDGERRITGDIPASDRDGVTRWTERFDAVHVGDEVEGTVDLSNGEAVLTSLMSPMAQARQRGASATERWTQFGPQFRPSQLPLYWLLQAGLQQQTRDVILTGMRWWQADGESYWLLTEPGGLSSSPNLTCPNESPSSWVHFAAVREAHSGAIGVATYCTDASGRSSFEVLLDYRVDYDLDTVAAHELGHGLGLLHSDDINAVMYPIAYPKDALGVDDINGLRALYPGPIAAYARVDAGSDRRSGANERARSIDARVIPVGVPGTVCPGNLVGLRIDPAEARPSFRGPGYNPSTGIMIFESDLTSREAERTSKAEQCSFPLTAVPLSDDDAGPGRVSLTPLYPGVAALEATTTTVRLPRAPRVGNVVASPSVAYTGEVVSLSADVSDLDSDLVTIGWDTDEDGEFDDASGTTAHTSYATTGPKVISIQAVDATYLSTTRTTAVVVQARPPAPPPPPVATPPAPPPPPPPAPIAAPVAPLAPPPSAPGNGSRDAAGGRRTVALRIRSASLSAGGRLRATASFTARADGRSVAVTVRALGRTKRYRQVIRNGKINIDRRVDRALSRSRHVVLTLRFAGSESVAPASASVAIR